jgi:phage I-like protein
MLVVSRTKFIGLACAASLFVGAALLCAQQVKFDGTWQMDTAKSKVSDGRVVTLTIVSVDGGIKMTMKTQKKDGKEATSEFVSKLNGKAADFAEGDHKSQITVWYNGPTLNASKEGGPAGDVTSAWKFEMGPDKGMMTMTISHYDPAADDETLVFTKK